MIGIVISAFVLSMIGLIIWNLEKGYIEEIDYLNDYADELEIELACLYEILNEVKDDIKKTKNNKEIRETIEDLFMENEEVDN